MDTNGFMANPIGQIVGLAGPYSNPAVSALPGALANKCQYKFFRAITKLDMLAAQSH